MDKEKKQFIIWGAIIIGIAAVWFRVVFYPTNRAIENLDLKKQELLGNMGREIRPQEIQALRMNIDSLLVQQENRAERLYPEFNLIGIGDFLKSVGQEAGLTLRDVTPDYTMINQLRDSQEEVNKFSLVVEYRGSFSQLTAFLDRLHNFPYYFKINEYFIYTSEEARSKLRIIFHGQMFLKKNESQTKQKV